MEKSSKWWILTLPLLPLVCVGATAIIIGVLADFSMWRTGLSINRNASWFH